MNAEMISPTRIAHRRPTGAEKVSGTISAKHPKGRSGKRFLGAEKGSGTNSAKHPKGRSGYWFLTPFPCRRGISLLEVLISMFVLLFGLLGLMAMIPVANFHLLKASQYDRAASVAQVAFGEIRTRGFLRPQYWITNQAGRVTVAPNNFLSPPDNRLRGTFCIDPLWMAPIDIYYTTNNFSGDITFPAVSSSMAGMAPYNVNYALRRVGWPGQLGQSPPMWRSLGDRVFIWNGDLSLELPDDHDVPSRLLTRRASSSNNPNDPPAETPLVRQSHGDYSWMFTATPSGQGPIWVPDGFVNFRPTVGHWVGDTQYEVSVVVFYKRVMDRNIARERMFEVVTFYGGLSGGEAQIAAQDETDFDGVREGQWLCLTALEPSGRLVAKWYRIITSGEGDPEVNTGLPTRWVGLTGPDWNPTLVPGNGVTVKATFVEDIVGVFTQTMSIVSE